MVCLCQDSACHSANESTFCLNIEMNGFLHLIDSMTRDDFFILSGIESYNGLPTGNYMNCYDLPMLRFGLSISE